VPARQENSGLSRVYAEFTALAVPRVWFYAARVGFAALIFDVDGVLVDSPHERAWRETLDELMRGPWAEVAADSSYTLERFDSAIYQALVSGKLREDGARAILDYFDVPDADARAAEFANEKQKKVVELINSGQFDVFPDAIPFVLDTKHLHLPIATASSSKNAADLLSRIRIDAPEVRPGITLLGLFDADVSGAELTHGKPHPDIFLAAASALGKNPRDCVVVEDAVAGIVAAKSGGMYALGISRHGDDASLQAAGADLVVDSLEHVSRDALAQGRLEKNAVPTK
jgi:HAD superfamily hydrolase (TIGR01509 family)